jgi:hypothetical protein
MREPDLDLAQVVHEAARASRAATYELASASVPRGQFTVEWTGVVMELHEENGKVSRHSEFQVTMSARGITVTLDGPTVSPIPIQVTTIDLRFDSEKKILRMTCER